MAFKHCISFATYFAANFGCNQFRITPDIVKAFARSCLKSLCCSVLIWADALSSDRSHFIWDLFCCKLWLWWIQNHAWHCFKAFARRHLKSLCCSIQVWADVLPRTGRRLRSAALHRILLGTCCFIPMSCFHSETNEWLQDWAKRWALPWLATLPQQLLAHSNGNSISNLNNLCHSQISTKH